MRKTKQEIVSEFRCAEILDAARKVFAKRGFAGVTVDEIADAAGVAKGTLYLYFDSKREIYLEALKQGIVILQAQTQRNMDAAKTTAGKMRAFISTRLNYFEENREFFKIYHSEFGNILVHPAHLNKEFKDLYSRQAGLLEAVLRKGVKDGSIRATRVDSAAFTIYDMTRGLITQRLLGWSTAAVDDDINFLFDLVWKGIGAA